MVHEDCVRATLEIGCEDRVRRLPAHRMWADVVRRSTVSVEVSDVAEIDTPTRLGEYRTDAAENVRVFQVCKGLVQSQETLAAEAAVRVRSDSWRIGSRGVAELHVVGQLVTGVGALLVWEHAPLLGAHGT